MEYCRIAHRWSSLQFHEIIDAECIHYGLLSIGFYFHLIIVHLMGISVKFFLKA